MSDAWIGLVGSILVALISLAGVIYSGNKTSASMSSAMADKLKAHSDASDARLEKAQAVTDERIQRLTDEVRKHNNFAEKIPVMEEQIRVANHRISDLESKI